MSDRKHVATASCESRDEVALERALQGEVGEKQRVAEDRMLDAVPYPLARKAEDEGAIGEAGAGKLGLVDAEKVR